MSVFRRLAFAACSLAVAACPALAGAAEPALSPEQAAAVNSLIHDYLMNNPKVVIDAIDHADAMNKAEAEQALKDEIVNRREELEHDPTSPVMGNPDGDVTVVEFFDFRCPYCKVTAPAIVKLLAEDPKVRLVLKDFPILGKDSVFASRVALVAQKHGKYAQFYQAMFELKDTITEESTLAVAKSIGLDPEQVKKEVESAEFDTILKNDMDLAKAVGADGTPAFIVGNTLSAGTITTDQLKTQIAELRAKSKG